MADTTERDTLQSYLRAQSAKLTGEEIGRRLEEVGAEFFAALDSVPPGLAGALCAP